MPTFRRPERVRRLLRALEAQRLRPAAVVVVDDASGGDTADRLRAAATEAPFPVEVVVAGANRGPGVARNLGWRRAPTDFVAFVDDDCVPRPDWLAAGLAALTADGRGVVQGATTLPAGQSNAGLPRWNHVQSIAGPTPFFEACNIFYRRDALEATGGFSEDHPRWGEDTHAGWSVLDAGWERGFAAGAVVEHDIELRGWGWWVRAGWHDDVVVGLARRFPGYRAAVCWRPWALRRTDAAFALAAAGGLLAVAGAGRRRPLAGGALLALPYLVLRRPSLRQPEFLRIGIENAVVDGARLAGGLRGSVRHRTLCL